MRRPAFKIKQLASQVFLLSFEDPYDMAMHFLRYQECFETPNPDFRGKAFKIIDFMEWYSKSRGHARPHFSYAADWSGFNLRGSDIQRVIEAGIPDPNHYDAAMMSAYAECSAKAGGREFYVIGSLSSDKATLRHEMAHATYYISKEYKKLANELVRKMPARERERLTSYLLELGYQRGVLRDETQAYMATGLPDALKGYSRLRKAQEPFIQLYQQFEGTVQ